MTTVKFKEENRQLELLKKTFNNIYEINTPITKSILVRAINIKEKSVSFHEEFSDEIKLEFVTRCPMVISHIKNPSPMVIKKAIDHDIRSAQFIEDIPYSIQKGIMESCVDELEYVNNIHESIQKEIVNEYFGNIRVIKNPIKEVQLLVIEKGYSYLTYINNPCTDILLKIYGSDKYNPKKDESLFDYLMNQSNIDPIVFHTIYNKSTESQKERIKNHKCYKSTATIILDSFEINQSMAFA